jgi:dynein regulatory complex protein 1
MQNEAISSSKANASIESKWVDLLAKDIPQELESEIHQQMQDCNAIIKSKDDLILEFQKQLRYKDEEYVNTLRKQVRLCVVYNTVHVMLSLVLIGGRY